MKQLKQLKTLVSQLSPFISPYKKSFILSVVFIIVSCLLNALSPMIEGLITTSLMNDVNLMRLQQATGVNFAYIIRIMMILLGLYIIQKGANILTSFLLTDAIQHSMRDMRNAIEEKIHRLPISYFDGHHYGDVLSRISNDIDSISNALQQTFNLIINGVLMVSFSIIMMIRIDFVMAMGAILIIPLSLLISKLIVKYSQKRFVLQQAAYGKLNSTITEMYTGYNEIQLYNKQAETIVDFQAVNQNLFENGFKAQFTSSLMGPMISLVTYLGIGCLAMMGALNVIAGVITVGNLQAFIRYIWQINEPLYSVSSLSGTIQSAFAAVERVVEILNEEEELDTNAETIKIDVPSIKGNVDFEHVRFGYSDDKILIQDLNIQVKSGQTIAIVGPTGAGKTTLINLLMRFYEVKGGSIKVDGHDLRSMSRDDLHSIFAMVLQDTWLYSGTIEDNIRYGKLSATRDEVVQAAKIANVHHFIKTLPQGYDTLLNEEVNNISVGEKQLLTIARAILCDPAIMILDEATSSVDTRLEMHLQKAMKNVMKNRTSFVIAHRLSTIRNADLILVMNQGEIIEQGNHDSLIAMKGFYETLYNSQFADCADEFE